MSTPNRTSVRHRPGGRPGRSRRLIRIAVAILFIAAADLATSGIQVALDAQGRLSVAADDAAVMDVVTEIGTLAGIRIAVSGTGPRQTGSWHFSGLRVDDGLERILEGVGHVMMRRAGGRRNGEVESLWILSTRGASAPSGPPGAPSHASPASPTIRGHSGGQEATDMEALLDRIADIEASGEADAVLKLEGLLTAGDPTARGLVVAALGRSGDPRAPQLLAQLLYGDPDPGVRHDAADALAGGGQQQAVGLLREALKDPDPRVRAHVEQLLQRIENRDP